jgi:hypothetical protein
MLLSTSSGNCLVFNTTGADNTTGVSNTFESNWWGAADGPSGAGGGSGDTVSIDIDFDPFLVTAPVGCPSVVLPTATPTSTSTATSTPTVTNTPTITPTREGAVVPEIPTLSGLGAIFLILLLGVLAVTVMLRGRS